jgi:mannosyltransferase
VKVIGAFAVGGLLFVPWLPSLLYQGAHTGTPWARPLRPTEMITNTLADLGGGPQAEAVLLGWLLAAVAVLGVFGHAIDGRRIVLDLRSQVSARPFLVFVAGTLAIASVVGYATGATYASRYAAVFVPFLLILAAMGLAQVRSRPLAVGLLAGLLVLGGIGSVRNAATDRTDAGRSAAAVRANGRPGDVVLFCPDQLGPSTSRSRLLSGFDQVTYPFLKRPQRVDWVDYTKRLAKADPRAVAQHVLQRAGNRRIFMVFQLGYVTHKESCSELYQALAEARPPKLLTESTGAFEPSTVAEFASPAPAPTAP